MENPIRYSDIVQPDDSIKNAIDQLKQLNATYEETMKKVKQEAIKVQASIENVSGATEQNRKKIQEASRQTDELSKAQEKLEQSMSDTAKAIAELKLKQNEQNSINKLMAKRGKEEVNLNNLKEKSYEQLSAQYSLNKIRLNKMSAEERAAAEESEQLVTATKAIYEQMKELQEATGKYTLDVGHYSEGWKSFIADMQSTGGAAGVVAGGFQTVGVAASKLAAHPIIAIFIGLVTVLGKLVEGFKKTESGINFINKASAVLNGSLNLVVKLAKNVTDAFKRAFQDPIETIKNLGKNIVTNIINRFKAIPKVGEAVYKVVKSIFTLDGDALKEGLKETGEALTTIGTGMNPDQVKAFGTEMKNLTGDIREQIDAFTDLAAAQRKSVIVNRDIEKTIADLVKEEQYLQSIADDNTKSFKEREEAAAKADELTKERAALEVSMARENLRLINTELDLKTKAGQVDDELLDKQVEAYKALREAESEYMMSVRDNDKRQAELKQDRLERDLDILIDGFDNQKTINERLIADETKTFEERRKLLEQTRALSDDSFAKQIETIQKFTGVQVDANSLIAEQDAIALNQKIRSLGLSEIIEGRLLEIVRERRVVVQDLNEAEKELNESQKKDTEEQQKQQKEQNKLLQERLDKEYDLRVSEIDLMKVTEEEKTRLKMEAERDRMQKLLALAEKGLTDMSDLEIATLRNTLKAIGIEIDKYKKSSGTRDIYDLVGLKLEDDQKDAISESVGFAVDKIKEILDAQLQAKEQALEAAKEESDAARERLNQEIEARNNGYASNVELARKELQLAKDKEAKALEEKKKAQLAQQNIDTLTQTSSLITATANIWKSLSGITAIGPALAIAAVGTMWGSFAVSKLKAREATKAQYGEGGLEFLEGGSHASGNDIPIGTMADGRQRTAEGGEALAVINKRNTRKYRRILPDVIASLNKGVFEDKYIGAFSHSDYVVNNSHIDLSNVEKNLSDIRKRGEQRVYSMPDGSIIIERKNIKTTIRR